MKLLSGLTPFWQFESMGSFVGKYLTVYANELIQGQKFEEAKSGDVFLLGGAVINSFNFEVGHFYKIEFKGKIKLEKGDNKGKFFNSFDIYELDENEILEAQN